MTGKEYADSIEFTKLTPDKYGNYNLPMEFIRSMLSMAFTAGSCDGLERAFNMVRDYEMKGVPSVGEQTSHTV